MARHSSQHEITSSSRSQIEGGARSSASCGGLAGYLSRRAAQDFALEDDIASSDKPRRCRSLVRAKKFSADILIFEASLAPNPIDAVLSYCARSQIAAGGDHPQNL